MVRGPNGGIAELLVTLQTHPKLPSKRTRAREGAASTHRLKKKETLPLAVRRLLGILERIVNTKAWRAVTMAVLLIARLLLNHGHPSGGRRLDILEYFGRSSYAQDAKELKSWGFHMRPLTA